MLLQWPILRLTDAMTEVLAAVLAPRELLRVTGARRRHQREIDAVQSRLIDRIFSLETVSLPVIALA